MIFKSSSSYNPWFYFFLFFVVDAYLSYMPVSDVEKYWVFLIGILTPVLLIFFSKRPLGNVKENIFQQESFEKSTFGLWMGLGALLMGLRFWKLTTLFSWPTGDESEIGMLAIGLTRDWNWHFFHGFAQVPFSFHWACCFFYQITHSAKLAVWFLPAAISAILIPLTYLGARRFCGHSFSIILASLMAVGFWPMYLGRAGSPVFMVFWELGVLYIFLVVLSHIEKDSCLLPAGWLGFITGLGSLTSVAWIVIGAPVFLGMIWVCFKNKKKLSFFIFFISMIVSLSPFLTAVLREGYGGHLQAVGFWNGRWDWRSETSRFLDYWMILWASINERVVYGTPWGGFLNPILASLFFLGLVEIYFRFSKFCFYLFLLALTICLAPGFLALTVQTFRILLVLPFLFLAAALGLQRLLGLVLPARKVWIALIILGLSFLADFSRLVAPFWNPDHLPILFENTGRSYEKYYAGRVLEGLHEHYGPGLIYTDLVPGVMDESLAFVTYPYNAAWNPEEVKKKPRWAAIFTNSHFQSFVSKRFPLARWEFIPSADPSNSGSHVLGIVPVTDETEPVFKSWQSTYDFFMSTNLLILDNANKKSNEFILKNMIEFYPRVSNDPFLQSVYLEKLLDTYTKERYFHPDDTGINYSSYAAVLNSDLKKGYPDAWVYAHAGRLLMAEKQNAKAGVLLRTAVRLDPQNELASVLLKILSQTKSVGNEK
jgi:hypothetical protein